MKPSPAIKRVDEVLLFCVETGRQTSSTPFLCVIVVVIGGRGCARARMCVVCVCVVCVCVCVCVCV